MKKYDALVIGASVGGLSAAALMARAGKRVLVLERQAAPPEPIGPVYALDPLLVSRLRLPARGLRFVSRDLPLALPPGALSPRILLSRDGHATTRALAGLSDADAKAWVPFRAELHGLARQLRRWWWSGLEEGTADWVLERQATRARFARLSLTGADAFLGAHFQSDALIAALLFDASAGGFHVSEPGSALALVWRAAQEMAGLEGAAATPVPGTLIWSLIKAAGAADFRCCATVTAIIASSGKAAGVRLATGEEIQAPLIFSSLPDRATQMLSGGLSALPPASGIGEARLLVSLSRKIVFSEARQILAERSGIYADAHEAARAKRLGDELPMELAPAEADASGAARIAVTIRPVPAPLGHEERVLLAARAVQALSRQLPGTAGLVGGVRFAASSPGSRATLAHLLAPSKLRVKTAIAGLYLCGAGAEPVACVSGRAAHIGVRLALRDLASEPVV